MVTTTQSLTLDEFLKLPETEPASDFTNGEIIQKPMPQGEHSLLQGELCEIINQAAKSQKIAYAFPELRCTFANNSIVPDVAVFRWQRIPVEPSGRIANRFEIHPDWAIEILSPDQRPTKVLEKLLHCSQHGTELGWLIDPEEESILIVFPNQRIELLRGPSVLPILSGIDVTLTAEQVFSWLKFS
jgi:Uma2 family endonuclease